MDDPILDYESFYREMQIRLRRLIPLEFMARKPVYKVRGNRMHIVLDGITGSHYEICFRREYHEIALHFQSTEHRNLSRRQAFDPLLKQISELVGYPVRAGKLENKGWMRIWIERPINPLTETLLADYTELFARFIADTFPTLEEIYQHENAE